MNTGREGDRYREGFEAGRAAQASLERRKTALERRANQGLSMVILGSLGIGAGYILFMTTAAVLGPVGLFVGGGVLAYLGIRRGGPAEEQLEQIRKSESPSRPRRR